MRRQSLKPNFLLHPFADILYLTNPARKFVAADDHHKRDILLFRILELLVDLRLLMIELATDALGPKLLCQPKSGAAPGLAQMKEQNLCSGLHLIGKKF